MTLDYKAQTHRSSWFTPAQCKSYYGVPYQFREIQIHWWNDPSTKPTHQGVVNYQANKTGGSCNYVASGGRVTAMVAEENCALTTQGGNPYGIKIECSPYGTANDYDTIGWLVSEIWKRRGKLPLVPHKRYFNTACPGTLDLNRIQAEAEKHYKGEISMGKITKEQEQVLSIAVTGDMPGLGYNYRHTGKDLTQVNVDELVNFWNTQSQVPGLKTVNAELAKTVKIKDAEIARLEKEIQLLQATQSEDTKNLNAFGDMLRWFIARLGVKK